MHMCQQLPLFYRCLIFIITTLINYGIIIALVRIIWPEKYESVRTTPSEAGSLVLVITVLLSIVFLGPILKCW